MSLPFSIVYQSTKLDLASVLLKVSKQKPRNDDDKEFIMIGKNNAGKKSRFIPLRQFYFSTPEAISYVIGHKNGQCLFKLKITLTLRFTF